MPFSTRRHLDLIPLPSGSFTRKKSLYSEGGDIRNNPTIFFGLLGIVLCCEYAYQQLVRAESVREHEFSGSEVELFHNWHDGHFEGRGPMDAFQQFGGGPPKDVALGDAVLANDGDLEEMLLPDGKTGDDVEIAYLDAPAPAPVAAGSGASGPLLDWEKVAAWKTPAAARLRKSVSVANDVGSSAAAVSRSDVDGARWNGRIPKVACITVVPRGDNQHPWIKHFFDNFRAQHYEGERKLVLLYHREDIETRRLVTLHSEGIDIISAAVNDTHLPSTTAFRYGAWLAGGLAGDVDVIARWDFDARYDPARLALQVQVLALTGRPACRLGDWTVTDSDTAPHKPEAQGNQADGTLVGEASWMRRHWFPILDGSGKWQPMDARELALVVDAPELATYAAGGK